MESLRPLREFTQRSFLQSLGERVEQAPDVAPLEFLMPWLPPFTENVRDHPVARHTHIRRTNDEVMRRRRR